jgi:hypothetical protein
MFYLKEVQVHKIFNFKKTYHSWFSMSALLTISPTIVI